jgi:AcrR family transcriptional regulator
VSARKNRESAARQEPSRAGGKHRSGIFKALHDCIVEQGYARTSLTDVARAAGMSPSHLLYYFPGKDAILEDYFAHVATRIIRRLEAVRAESPERVIDELARLFFSGAGMTKSEAGFMLECFGVAVHDRPLHREKAELDRYCKNYLREMFERSPCGPEAARDAAEVAYAMLVGLRTAAFFDERLGPQKALEIFRTEVMKMADRRQRVLSGKASGRPGRKKRVSVRAGA